MQAQTRRRALVQTGDVRARKVAHAGLGDDLALRVEQGDAAQTFEFQLLRQPVLQVRRADLAPVQPSAGLLDGEQALILELTLQILPVHAQVECGQQDEEEAGGQQHGQQQTIVE